MTLQNTHFFRLTITNSKNIHKNIPEISDQNRTDIKVTFLYFATNQLKIQNKNILEISDQNHINIKVTILYFSTNHLKTQNKNILENPV